MSRSRFLINLAISLFVAPTPALLLLAVTAGQGGIPPAFGLAAMAASAGLYWIWLLRRRAAGRRSADAQPEREAREEAVAPGAPGTALVLRNPVAGTGNGARHRADPRNRNTAHNVRSFEDLPDPVAERHGLQPAEILIDRVSDILQVKRLVAENRVQLLTAWYRQVRDTASGDRDYGDWALEADRVLLSAAFMTRTLTRHEAIALVTAELSAMVANGQGAEVQSRAHTALGGWVEPRNDAPTGVAAATADIIAAAPRGARAAPAVQRSGGVVRMLPQVAMRRCSAILECAGWRTHIDAEAAPDGIDMFAERHGHVVGLRCVAGDEIASAETVHRAALAGSMFGADLVAVVAMAGFGRDVRAAAAQSGVVLLGDSDLAELDSFLPPTPFGDGAGHSAAAE